MSFAELQSGVDRHLASRPGARVLEAGCGSASHLEFGGAHLTGIDVSERQLARNSSLDRRIVGDLQEHRFAPEFDLIVCWDVLEHLPDPSRALANLLGGLAPGGRLVIAAPDPASVKGLVTKFTPYRFHVWVYRLAGFEGAGEDDRGPFPTFMRFAIRPARIARFAGELGYETVWLETRESALQRSVRRRVRLRGRIWETVRRTLIRVTAGRFDPAATDFVIVLRAAG